MISESTIQQIKDRARIEDFADNGNAKKGYGQNKLYITCPACGYVNDKKKQGLIIDTQKNIAKCYSCGQSYGGAIDFVMKTEGLDYPAALRYIANEYKIFIEETEKPESKLKQKFSKAAKNRTTTPSVTPPAAPEPSPEPTKKSKSKKKAATPSGEPATATEPETSNPEPQKPHSIKSFCDTQLQESGLTYDDIRVETVSEDGTTRFVSPFIQGTRDQYGLIVEHRGDDVLIKYYDLEGRPVMYKPEKSTQLRHLIRVRWQNPAAHPDQSGEPIKYQSPKGSGSHVYIPERLRVMYKHARPIDRLFIQEGEKKAEKACKHGLMSLGIMGINNLGYNNRLPDEVQFIIQRCNVKEVIFLLDSDWRNLSEDLQNGQAVDNRPRQFFSAVRNYKEYLRTLANLGHPVEIYFGYIKYNDAREKGIDDLLTGTLAGKETELKTDFDFAINEKSGAGQFIQVNKITMLPDSKIADFWLLNDAEKFADHHKKKLENLKEFKIKGYLRRFNEKGKLEMAQQLLPEEEFWDENVTFPKEGEPKRTLTFNYVNAMIFLQNRGFYRFKMRSGEKSLVKIENRIITAIDHTEVKDFVKEFCREIKRNDVLNMLMRGGPQYLGPEKLTNLDIINLPIERATAEKQCLFFKDKIWEITADGIKEINYGQFSEYIWSEKIIPHKVTALSPMMNITLMDDEIRRKVVGEYKDIENGEFFIDYSEDAEKSHFLQFLRNASNFFWRKIKKGEELTIEERFIISRHFINKLTAIGYLLHDYKDDNELKAVIGMDGKLSEVGASNGRSGKSLQGYSLSYLIPQVYVNGKDTKLNDDQFRYHEVTEKTKSLFFDDVRANFDFESLFPVITGSMGVNQKSGLRFTLKKDESPKIYVSTNHAINGEGSSFTDRQAYVVYSDFYNDNHKPVHDFGMAFWSEWDADQWNLFFNLMANCLVLYFRSKQNGWSDKRVGIVRPPMEDVEKRRLRQTMGENFLIWADAFFYWDEKMKTGNINERHIRKELNDLFLADNPMDRKYTNAHRFKEKIVAFCKYKGYDLNPTKRNDLGLDISEYYRLYPFGVFIGDVDKTGGKEYFTIANHDFNKSMM